MRGGAVWSREIEQTLDASSSVLALLSHGSYESDICRAEQLRALRKGKCVIPLLAQPDAEIPLQLEPRHFVDFCDSTAYAERLDELVAGAAAGMRDPHPSEACRSCDFARFCEPGRAWLAEQDAAGPG